jgi:hypothetical protein
VKEFGVCYWSRTRDRHKNAQSLNEFP